MLISPYHLPSHSSLKYRRKPIINYLSNLKPNSHIKNPPSIKTTKTCRQQKSNRCHKTLPPQAWLLVLAISHPRRLQSLACLVSPNCRLGRHGGVSLSRLLQEGRRNVFLARLPDLSQELRVGVPTKMFGEGGYTEVREGISHTHPSPSSVQRCGVPSGRTEPCEQAGESNRIQPRMMQSCYPIQPSISVVGRILVVSQPQLVSGE